MLRNLERAYLTTDVGMIHLRHKLHDGRREGIVFFQVNEQFEEAPFEWRVIRSSDKGIECPVVRKNLVDSNIITILLPIKKHL